MNKRALFLAAMKAGEYRRRAWVITAFSLVNEGPEEWRLDPYAYRIVQTPAGHYFVDPENKGELSKIEDAAAGMAPYAIKERVDIDKGDIPNATKKINTTYGNLLFNYIVVVYPFGSKIPYLEGRFSPRDMESKIITRLKDTPKTDDERDDKTIYIDEYLRYANAAFSTVAFSQVSVPATTAKTMVAAPGIHALRDKLVKENEGQLHNPAVIAAIDAQLVAYDKEYLKGDPGSDYLINAKSWDIVRKKQFGMLGAEMGLSEGVSVQLVPKSLSEGWDINHFPQMNDVQRAGSFNRGAQTMLGGESVKWLLRASSNVAVTMKDCGSNLGIEMSIDNDNLDFITGAYVISNLGLEHVPDVETAKAHVGKTVLVRSPMFCKLENTDYCECCVGDKLAANPTAMSSAVAETGSVFLAIYMKAAHGKALTVAEWDYETLLF